MLSWSIALAVLLLSSSGAKVLGQTITANPNPPQLGNPCTYTAAKNPLSIYTVSNYKFEYRRDDGVCVTTWGPLTDEISGTGGSVSVYEEEPGTFDVRCTLTYADPQGGNPPPPDVVTMTITINPPNGSAITAGLNKPTPTTIQQPTAGGIGYAQGVWFEFKLQSGGTDVGGHIRHFVAQEKITNAVLGGTPHPDSDWLPTGSDARFYLKQQEVIKAIIEDFK